MSLARSGIIAIISGISVGIMIWVLSNLGDNASSQSPFWSCIGGAALGIQTFIAEMRSSYSQ